jgi:hypothetical protein
MREEGEVRVLGGKLAKFDSPMIIGCTITVSMPAFFAAAICARSASRSPVRLGT